MMAAPLGACVGIYYDGRASVARGDAIVTKTGRTYVVVAVRVQTRGLHAGRQHLRCLVQPAPPAGARVHPIRWYRRRRKGAG